MTDQESDDTMTMDELRQSLEEAKQVHDQQVFEELTAYWRSVIAEATSDAQAAGMVAVLLRCLRDAIGEKYAGVEELSPAWGSSTHHWSQVAQLCNTAVFLLYPLFETELTEIAAAEEAS